MAVERSAFAQRIHEVLAQGGDRPAISFQGRWHTWADLYGAWKSIEALLDSAGVPADAAVAYVARTRVQHAAVVLGAFAEGRTLSTIYALQSPTLIGKDITGLSPAVVIADRDDWTPEVVAAAKAAGSAGIAISAEAPRASIVPGLERSTASPYHRAGDEHEVEVLSSGTTGTPKRIRLPIRVMTRTVTSLTLGGNIARNVSIIANALGNIGGLMSLVAAAYQDSPAILIEKFNVRDYVDAVREHKVKVIGGSSAVYRHILQAKVPREDLASVQIAFGGSDALDHETQKRVEETYGFPVLWGYGATEFAGTLCAWTPPLRREFGDSKPGSIGRPLPGGSARVVDPESGKELGTGEMGVLEGRIDLIGPNWIRTNDLATIDADGFVFLHGRADYAINRGGFKILPDRVARVLRQHPSVLDAAVIGMPDPILGEVPVAAIERRPDADAPTPEALEKLVRDNLPSHHVPKRFVIVDALPRTASLKVRMAELRQLLG